MKYMLSMMIIALLVVGAAAAPRLTSAQQDEARTGVRPEAGAPGATFYFFATGFAGGGDDDEDKETVSVWINAPDGSVTTDNINQLNEPTDTGRIDWQWTSPDNAQPGIWSAVAYGNDSGLELVIPFEIRLDAPAEVPESPEDLRTNVEPNAGPGGTTFAFYAIGFSSEEDVYVWLNTPGGVALDADVDDLNRATESGRADWSWRAPGDAQPGMWSMVARGAESGVEHVIPFEILPPQ